MCSLMRESDVEPKLKDIGEFTLFVPSDEAMSLMPGSMSDELSNDPQKRNQFILSHVVPGNILLRPMRPYQEISTSSAQGTPIKISAYIDGVSTFQFNSNSFVSHPIKAVARIQH
ncbi:uncharacterized protein B4U80_14045 [Leptotrombidium deliense]|uniref:FAS1 domain-containing protein n=1 Tax=Leptotrombidium deliense TaxID=299467 RepID=A0A443S489_9ACAR|nr:uncharacterized protein B4U80_14045 [Leptotrombidium deliense]